MSFILYTLIVNVFDLIQLLIIVRVILSWVPHNQYNQIIYAIYQITEYIFKPIREFLPFSATGIDFSPFLAFLFIGFIKKLLLVSI